MTGDNAVDPLFCGDSDMARRMMTARCPPMGERARHLREFERVGLEFPAAAGDSPTRNDQRTSAGSRRALLAGISGSVDRDPNWERPRPFGAALRGASATTAINSGNARHVRRPPPAHRIGSLNETVLHGIRLNPDFHKAFAPSAPRRSRGTRRGTGTAKLTSRRRRAEARVARPAAAVRPTDLAGRRGYRGRMRSNVADCDRPSTGRCRCEYSRPSNGLDPPEAPCAREGLKPPNPRRHRTRSCPCFDRSPRSTKPVPRCVAEPSKIALAPTINHAYGAATRSPGGEG